MTELNAVIENCKVTAIKIDENKDVEYVVNTSRFSFMKSWLDKKVGDMIITGSGKKLLIKGIEEYKTEAPPEPPKLTGLSEEEKNFIRKMLDGEIDGKNISYSYGSLPLDNSFRYGKIYGNVARKIYYKGVDIFDFDVSKAWCFGRKQLLYSEKCTREGYSVWMFANSCINGKVDSARLWINNYDISKREIIQYTLYDDYDIHDKDEKRLAFIKQKSGEYVFVGVYALTKRHIYKGEVIKAGECSVVVKEKEIYSMISNEYPF